MWPSIVKFSLVQESRHLSSFYIGKFDYNLKIGKTTTAQRH